jgi:hypothetical protein
VRKWIINRQGNKISGKKKQNKKKDKGRDNEVMAEGI